MTSIELTLELENRQGKQSPLTPEDRRLLLGASLRVLGYRFHSGKAILKDDVIRVASLADDSASVTV